MARSIHTTRRTLGELRKKVSAQQQSAGKELEKARESKWRKRLVKRSVRKERRQPNDPPAPTPVGSIPIEVLDESATVIHAATREDLLAILSSFPDSATNGISRIQLSSGAAYQREILLSRKDEDHVCDPVIGRPGREIIPGVYTGLVLGKFSPKTGLISLHAFVIEPSRIPLPEPAWRLYLKLHALKTFVHEVAHHHDQAARVGRGRWLADRRENVENYAERMEHQWTQTIVIPYLETKYQKENSELLGWVEHHGGVRLDLSSLAGDPRRTERNGLVRLVFGVDEAFESWVTGFHKFKSVLQSRLKFAEELHYSDRYEECLLILDGILSVETCWVEARLWKADTLVHLDRLDEAEAIVRDLLAKDAQLERACTIQGDIYETRKDWRALLENSEQRLRLFPNSKDRKYALLDQAVAYCAIGDTANMESQIRQLISEELFKHPERLRKVVFRRAGVKLP